MIHGLQPYKGGNDLLWALHECSLVDKHNRVLTMAATVSNFNANATLSGLSQGYNYISVPQWQCFDEEAVLFTFPKGAQLEANSEIGAVFCVAFGDIDVIHGQAVIATLQQFVDLTDAVIRTFEDRFFPS